MIRTIPSVLRREAATWFDEKLIAVNEAIFNSAPSGGVSPAPRQATTMNQCQISDVEVTECIGRLDELVTRSVNFLQDQLRRLDQQYKEFDELQNSQGGPARQFEDLSEQQAAWERRQAEEADRINEQLECLNQAWNELEEEQRQYMIDGRSPAPAVREAEQTVPPDQFDEIPENLGVDLVDAPCDLSSSAAEIQFQKLKREIRQHARRNR